jgi:hypothetical protein
VGRHLTSKSSLTREAPFNLRGNIVISFLFSYILTRAVSPAPFCFFHRKFSRLFLLCCFPFTVLSVDALFRDLCFVVYGLRLCRYCLGDEGIIKGGESWWGLVVCHLRCAVVVCVMSV